MKFHDALQEKDEIILRTHLVLIQPKSSANELRIGNETFEPFDYCAHTRNAARSAPQFSPSYIIQYQKPIRLVKYGVLVCIILVASVPSELEP